MQCRSSGHGMDHTSRDCGPRRSRRSRGTSDRCWRRRVSGEPPCSAPRAGGSGARRCLGPTSESVPDRETRPTSDPTCNPRDPRCGSGHPCSGRGHADHGECGVVLGGARVPRGSSGSGVRRRLCAWLGVGPLRVHVLEHRSLLPERRPRDSHRVSRAIRLHERGAQQLDPDGYRKRHRPVRPGRSGPASRL